MSIRAQVISTIDEKGIDQMGPDDLIVKYHSVDVRTRSRLIVYSNQKAVVRIQGQIQGVFDSGGSRPTNTCQSNIPILRQVPVRWQHTVGGRGTICKYGET
ncbi:hypothetical protein [Vulcanisaeta souniana]|uniref:hypothetical protein n=1 Tax=Vulcanisaeta souniana TaxID=164452 RepID=UPI001FB52840|nr:hypothetical protein [Vulcanisaeta souniana]